MFVISCAKSTPKQQRHCKKSRSDLVVILAVGYTFSRLYHQGGERFDKVAQDYSEDKAKGTCITARFSCENLIVMAVVGGSLGWMTRGSMVVCPIFHMTAKRPFNNSLAGPLPGRCVCFDTFIRRQTSTLISHQDRFRLSHNHGGRPTLISSAGCREYLPSGEQLKMLTQT
jgi:hypothetical protein